MNAAVETLSKQLAQTEGKLIGKAKSLSSRTAELESVLNSLTDPSGDQATFELDEAGSTLIADLGGLGQLLTERDELASALDRLSSVPSPSKRTPSSGSSDGTRRKRITAEERDQLRSSIVEALRAADSPLGSAEIKAAIGRADDEDLNLSPHMAALKKDSKIKQEGERINAKYSIA